MKKIKLGCTLLYVEHTFADPAEFREASEFESPEDILEPEHDVNAYRDAAQIFLAKFWGCLQFLKETDNAAELSFRLDLLMLVFAHPDMAGLSLTDIANRHKKTRAAASAQAVKFQRANNLPPNLFQKQKETSAKYHAARKAKLT